MRAMRWMILALLAATLACMGGPPSNAIIIEVQSSTALASWMESAVEAFNRQRVNGEDGRPVYVQFQSVEAGQAVANISAAGETPDLWIPDSFMWVGALQSAGVEGFDQDCLSVAQSPLVIAIWRPLAEALGWPGRELGWLDIGSLAADPSAWRYYSGGEFGEFLRLGHTHPGLSGSGAGTLLALVQAAQAKTEAVSAEEVESPIVQASVGAFEGAVSWFSPSTEALATTMLERGERFLGATMLYESNLLALEGAEPEIVPLYPFEGTFVADFPACVFTAGETQNADAARRFRDYLLGEGGQALAVEHGLRPLTGSAQDGPLAELPGVDLNQPQVVFESAQAPALLAIQTLWQSARKDVSLAMLIDVSGSMEGQKLELVKEAAVRFVQQMGDDDSLTLIAFSESPEFLFDNVNVGENKDLIAARISALEAFGSTTLFDAIGLGAEYMEQIRNPEKTSAMVVLTDGVDTASFRFDFDEILALFEDSPEATVFTIAYGSDADEDVLEELALGSNGNFYLGDEASIGAIYQEMSAAFGGSAGVGR